MAYFYTHEGDPKERKMVLKVKEEEIFKSNVLAYKKRNESDGEIHKYIWSSTHLNS
jgi:hypothetical protein